VGGGGGGVDLKNSSVRVGRWMRNIKPGRGRRKSLESWILNDKINAPPIDASILQCQEQGNSSFSLKRRKARFRQNKLVHSPV